MTARGLSRRFGEKLAVDAVDLDVRRGEILALLGHNGAGKTTTVRLLNGVLAPSAGEARIFGLSPERSGPAVRARIGVLTESQSLEERLDARENLRYFAALYGYPAELVEGRIDELLEEFGLSQAADKPVGGFSKGMKQRLALARALQHEPELLFLDEPTSGLDPVASRQVNEMIVSQSREAGRTVVLCTHNLTEAQQICDRVAVMRDGRIVALGTPAELAARTAAHSLLRVEVAPTMVEKALAVVKERMAPEPPEAREEASGLISLRGVRREAIPDLVSGLVAAGIAVYRVEPRAPTLQEVYFALYGEPEPEDDGNES